MLVGSRVTLRVSDRELARVIDQMCGGFRNHELAQGVIGGGPSARKDPPEAAETEAVRSRLASTGV